jgi:LemA protein
VSQRGSALKAVLIILVVLVVLIGIAVATLGGRYNRLVGLHEQVKAAWSEIDNQYKRRYDLVPQLVSTVQGAADFEKSTLENVTEARASVGRMQLPSELPSDPGQLQQYMQAQNSLGGALGRLLVVAERYPQLQANESFLSLQDQLEGTENRIAVARRDYIDSVRVYNTEVRRFPTNIVAGLFGFERVPQLESSPEERETPQVEFEFDN